MLEKIVKRFQSCGCTFLEHVDFSSSSDWISDTLFIQSKERQKLLEWWLGKIDSGHLADPAQILQFLGICSSSDATSFVSGKMSKSKQMNVWADLAGLGVEEEVDPDEIKRNNTSTSAFLEAVSENIEIEKFQNSKLQVLPFHFEQEIKKIDKKGSIEPAVTAISLENLKRTLDDGNNILKDLEKYEQFSNDVGSSEPIIGKLIKVSEEMNDNIEAFNVKHNTEFSSWLAKSEVSTKYKDREEILQMEGVVSALACQLHSKTQIAENLEAILDGGQRDIRRLSSVVSMSDLEDVDETITFNASNVNMSRAPAAS